VARALGLHPQLVVCDEPASALDVSIQAQTLNLLQDLQEEFGLTYLFISHDLSVIEHISDRVAVMYVGKLVETAPTEELFLNPRHPYTQALLESIPRLGQRTRERRRLASIRGMMADPYALPQGCSFNLRCREAQAGKCNVKEPALVEVEPGHLVRCFPHT
jgi:peptide/nickel transport system ATP-binding protein